MSDTTRLTLSQGDAERIAEVEQLSASASVEPLIGRLGDQSWAVRRAVVAALARIGTPAVRPLCELLLGRRRDEAQLAAAVDALAACRGEVEAPLVQSIATNPPPPVLCDLAQVLGRRRSRNAVPVLERLGRHADDNVAVAAVEALGRIGGGVAVELMVELVRGRNFFRTFPAIEVLGQSADPRAVDPLLELLEQPLFAVEALRALGRVADERAVPALVALLRSGDSSLVRAAAVALVHVRRQAGARRAAELVERALAENPSRAFAAQRVALCLRGAEPAEEEALCRVLGWLGDPASIPALLALLPGERPIAECAMQALRSFQGALDRPLGDALRTASGSLRLLLLPLVRSREVGIGAVGECLDDPDPLVRQAACSALARVGDPGPVRRLFSLLDDENAGVAQAAIAAIQALGSGETEALALAAAGAPQPRVRRGALRVIAYFGYAAGLPALLEALADPDERMRDAAANGLAYLEDPRAAEALLTASRHAAAKTRASAIRALGLSASTAATAEALRVATSDPDAWVRYFAAQALGKQRDLSSGAVLMALLDDPAGQVRIAAVEALAQLRTDDALSALLGAARSEDADMRRAALTGLGLGGRAEALPLLVAAVQDPDAATRLVALGALAGRDQAEVVAALARAATDPDDSVRSAALEHLAVRPGEAATEALIALAADAPPGRLIDALAQPLEGRIVALLRMLEAASEVAAGVAAEALARMGRPDADAALVAALTLDHVPARRAAAEALAGRARGDARAVLERAAVDDPDAEVRRLCAFALGR